MRCEEEKQQRTEQSGSASRVVGRSERCQVAVRPSWSVLNLQLASAQPGQRGHVAAPEPTLYIVVKIIVNNFILGAITHWNT